MSTAEELDDVMEEVEYTWPDLEVDVDEDGVARLAVSRPDALNALNAEVVGQIREAIEELAMDDAVSAIVLTGSGDKAFVAGADIAPLSFTEVRIIPHVADGPTPIDAISLAHLIMPRFQTTMAPS